MNTPQSAPRLLLSRHLCDGEGVGEVEGKLLKL